MNALEVRELARVVIDAGGNLADLKALVVRWEASVRVAPVAATNATAKSEGCSNGDAPPDGRTVADLTDDELLAIFPGSTVEHGPELESDIAPCGCRHRIREWRLRGEGVDVSYTRASSREALDEAAAAGRGVLRTGKRSGWTYGTTPTGRGHPWTCALCHPPAKGLDFEVRDLTRRLRRWRISD